MVKIPKLLVVIAPQRKAELLRAIDRSDMQIYFASNVCDALRKLYEIPSIDLILADEELPDGSWRDLIERLLDSRYHCEMIVCSRRGDEELWAEVLQRGAYDLIVEPYEQQEVQRIIDCAIETKTIRRFGQPVAS